ncbi:MFS transporter [Actinoplanes sp. SE50]|uniref:MFS transporter n=1 Tax=unclassified Actinoplanes TaxID=2626549 RepID=UPI00023EC9B6|nr:MULTISPECIES: MFS transporter [unclassified Actinoplanes]AEV85400.1 major facilitator superfamily MFS_1 [Actinoplanes sp. SE50/110]ATO83795.1 MFS transporter [Actinoplanes sp. SE50]SLM01203.1 MFS transporter [Actinoplanes sp. SE50/110]
MWPLYAAGFTTAFGAHAIAANLGGAQVSLLTLGGLLALYDGAEIVLKPVFGSLADRIGPRPVLLGGLVAFALASAVYVAADSPGWLWAARLGQGAAASAFSPAASALVARLNPGAKHGRAFGSYGFYKSIGYTLGPLLGGVIVWAGGLRSLFVVLAGLGAAVAVWALLAVPHLAPLPKTRQTLLDLARRLTSATFLRPTSALAAATAALSVGVGFLPVTGRAAGLSPIATGAAVSVLALCAALVQPRAGRALDDGRLSLRTGLTAGLLLTALGLAAALLPGLTGVLAGAALIGAGTGLITPLGFAALAGSTPPERLGQTMGAAELGRELGDAGGPLLVGAIATATTLNGGFAVLAVLVGALAAILPALPLRHVQQR